MNIIGWLLGLLNILKRFKFHMEAKLDVVLGRDSSTKLLTDSDAQVDPKSLERIERRSKRIKGDSK